MVEEEEWEVYTWVLSAMREMEMGTEQMGLGIPEDASCFREVGLLSHLPVFYLSSTGSSSDCALRTSGSLRSGLLL